MVLINIDINITPEEIVIFWNVRIIFQFPWILFAFSAVGHQLVSGNRKQWIDLNLPEKNNHVSKDFRKIVNYAALSLKTRDNLCLKGDRRNSCTRLTVVQLYVLASQSPIISNTSHKSILNLAQTSFLFCFLHPWSFNCLRPTKSGPSCPKHG